MVAEERGEALAQAREREAAGDWPGVVALLDPLDGVDLLAEPELGFLLATALRRVGERDRAFALTIRLAGPCERQQRDGLARRRLNLEAALYFDRGAVAEAASRWAALVDAATRAGDDAMLSNACNNLGVAHTLLGHSGDALASYARALAAAQRLGDRRGLAQARHNLAICFRELGFLTEAAAHFDDAVMDAALAGSDEILGRAEEERALVILQMGDARLAEATARRALNRFRSNHDHAGEGEALRVLGIIALAHGHYDHARDHLNAALERARAHGSPLLEAETLDALAILAEVAGESAGEETGQPIFAAMGAAPWGQQLRRRLRAIAGLPGEDT